MAKWADYCISAVRFNDKHTHIDAVRRHEDKDTSIGAPSDVSRSRVVSDLKQGVTYVTITKGDTGSWEKGPTVFITKINEVIGPKA